MHVSAGPGHGAVLLCSLLLAADQSHSAYMARCWPVTSMRGH